MKNVKPGHVQPFAVLDPGHCGSRYNAGAVKGYYESDIMWKLAHLQAEAMKGYGIKVIITRTQKEMDVPLIQRGMMAEDADIFESLHSNACDTERVDRPEGIYLYDDDCGAIDAQSKEFAALMAQTVRDCMDTNDPAKIFSRRSSNDRDHDGKKNDDYYAVLFGCHQVGTAGCITEHSFHTNKRMAAWLLDDRNLQKLAKAKAAAYAKWFDLDKPASAPREVKATEPAYSKDNALKGAYKVTAAIGLNIRNGAGTKANNFGTDKHTLVAVPKGTKVTCWGYYTDVNGAKWLLVQVTYSGIKYTGFACESWLKKV